MDRAFTAAAAALVATFMLAWVSAKEDAVANPNEPVQTLAQTVATNDI
ncbi:hypothetical protein GGQ59_002249 [Parvularcula dongshanensis]|uniref:Uncharacterized protein n=1 Tax=Parvularcula dongshanensis TaxID=1173995 RepID=A0A840I6E7_9PROT|nr:hypothetical protein [Parvularcula dongshanensis]